jgi:hypothetical protein
MRADSFWICAFGTTKVGQVAREFDVLPLVVADRHDVRLVEQDVGGHEDRVGEEPDR